MYEYLNDITFLQSLDKVRMRTQYVRITLLTFNEEPIREIQGQVISGTLTVNGNSAIRRTMQLSMVADRKTANIENIENEIAINKKVKVEVGYKNNLKEYADYGDIIWFPCGLFVLSQASVTRNVSSWTITVSGKDKMCLLDGTVGGVIPANTTFHEKEIVHNDGTQQILKTKIFDIIFEAVNHFGGEAVEKIIITDVPDVGKMLVKYDGLRPLYFSSDYTHVQYNYDANHPIMITAGQDAGYEETDFIYPGELILDAGSTVVNLLDKIIEVLGNYEYYYDINGNFIFQEIKNYLNQQSPLYDLYEDTQRTGKFVTDLGEEDYVKTYDNKKFLYSLTDLDTTTSIARTPKFDNIKNDFYVWGWRETASGVEEGIRYHLAIDEKPSIRLAACSMWEVKDQETGLLLPYVFDETEAQEQADRGYTVTKISEPCDEWREELYRRALQAQVTNSVQDNYYDEENATNRTATNNAYDNYYSNELIAEWRKLYDPMNSNYRDDHWNPAVFMDPDSLVFWLDFIDTGSEMGQYSVKEIGRRTKVENNTSIKSIYNKEVPDIVFVRNQDASQRKDIIDTYNQIGQKYVFLTDNYYDLFSISSTSASCFDEIRNMLYQNLTYNTTISITCLPKYYMEPHNIIYVEDKASGIMGNYEITQFTLPLAYNGTMSITAAQVFTRV